MTAHDAPERCIAVRTQVRWGECDPAGIAYYPRFFDWMDLAMHRLARELGVQPEDMLPPKLGGFPLVGARAEFLRPARYGDELEVRAWVARVGRTSFTLRHEIVRVGEEDAPLARGREDRVYIGRAMDGPMRPQPLTHEMRAVLARYADGTAEHAAAATTTVSSTRAGG